MASWDFYFEEHFPCCVVVSCFGGSIKREKKICEKKYKSSYVYILMVFIYFNLAKSIFYAVKTKSLRTTLLRLSSVLN